MLKFETLFVLFILSARVSAQEITEYKPVQVSKDSVYLNERKFKQTLNFKDVPGLSKDGMSELKDIYCEKRKRYLDNTKNHAFIIEPKLTAYLNNILQTILKEVNIPEKDSFKIHLNRSTVPNAYCSGDWNLYFNMDLIFRLENESQMAYVIGHEVAHQLLDHIYKHITYYLKIKYSQELKQQIKDLKNTEYDKMDRLVELIKKKTYSSTEHEREDEKSADSLGILLVMKTGFDARESIRALQILDSLEGDTFVLDYKKHFDGETYKFKSSFLEKPKTMSFGGKAVYELDEDSAKTHPDCPKRIVWAKELLKDYSAEGKKVNIQPEDVFKNLAVCCKFEELEYLFFKKRYALCIFKGLHLSEEFPNDAYPVNMVTNCFAQIIETSKQHKLYENLSKPAPNFQENYNQLLRLFDRANINDLAQINSNYVNVNHAKFNSNATFEKLFKQYDLITHKF